MEEQQELASWAPTGRVTRGFLKQLCQSDTNGASPSAPAPPQQSYAESSGGARSKPSRGIKKRSHKKPQQRGGGGGKRGSASKRVFRTLTVVPVNYLPAILERIVKALPPAQSSSFEIYEIQNYLVACSLDNQRFAGKEEELFQHVVDTVTTDERYCRPKHGTASASEWDAEVVRRYDEFMNTPEQQKHRSYRNDSDCRRVWTERDVQRFKEAFEKYGYGPTSNRKIAEYIGNGVHPNHVAYFKLQMKRQQREASKQQQGEATAAPTEEAK